MSALHAQPIEQAARALDSAGAWRFFSALRDVGYVPGEQASC